MYELMGVNLLAIAVAAIASMALGFLWYGPFFGKVWMREMKFKMPSKGKMPNMTKTYMIATLGSAVTVFVLGYFINALGALGWMGGALVGLWAAVGFAAMMSLNSVLWEGRTWKLYSINVGYHLANLFIMGAILGAWI